MARPNRNDVDYFPLYCKEGKTMHFIRKKFGNDGYVVWIRTLRALAIKNYHYLDFNDETELLFHASDCDVEPNIVLSVLDCLAQFGEIDKEFWENKVVWSEKFIDSIKDAYRKRAVKIQLRADILRLSSALNHISSAVNEVSSAINPQRKEEKSKEENIKEKSKHLWNEILNSSMWFDALIKNNFTTKEYLTESLKSFWVIANYLENPIDDVNEVKKHFANWLKTNPPKKIAAPKDDNPAPWTKMNDFTGVKPMTDEEYEESQR